MCWMKPAYFNPLQLDLTHELRRNPPVTIEVWPDPDLNPEFNDDEEPADNWNEPIGGPDHDPEYVEHP
jgi:uncharacterized protein Usg